MPGAVVHAEVLAVNKTDPKKDKKSLCSHEAYILLWDTHNKQIKKKIQSAKKKISAKGYRDW